MATAILLIWILATITTIFFLYIGFEKNIELFIGIGIILMIVWILFTANFIWRGVNSFTTDKFPQITLTIEKQ